MTNELIEFGSELYSLGKCAVACKGWRWMPGMRWLEWLESDCGEPDYTGRIEDEDGGDGVIRQDRPGEIPDLSDPATLGCLLALVREAHEDSTIYCEPQRDGTFAVLRLAGLYLYAATVGLRGDTEAGALVWTLEAA